LSSILLRVIISVCKIKVKGLLVVFHFTSTSGDIFIGIHACTKHGTKLQISKQAPNKKLASCSQIGIGGTNWILLP